MIQFRSIAAYFFLAIALLVIPSCGGDDGPNGSSEDQLQAFFTENNINPVRTASGLYYVIDEPGSQEKPTPTSTVTVIYKGYFLDGDEFDSSGDAPITFSLRNVIRGWQEGIPLFGKGGSGSLYIPAEQAYGSRGNNSIPGNTAIAFDIEVVDF